MSSTNEIENKEFMLDPLSVIIKLAIIGYKPVGTKICVLDNIVSVQEVGIFQPLVRYFFNNKRLDLHHLYNPIEFACDFFLNDEEILEELPNIKDLFEAALSGIDKLRETYSTHALIVLCLNYYSNLISNYLGENYNEELFKENQMTSFYKKDIVSKLNDRWAIDKIQVILELNNFLKNNTDLVHNVSCMETFMQNIDADTQKIISAYALVPATATKTTTTTTAVVASSAR